MTDRLFIAAKAPRAGLAKTRLARALGADAAARLYGAFLKDLADRFAAAPFGLGWYVTPDDAWDELAPLIAGSAAAVLGQGDGDWTERQRRLFRDAPARGERRTVLIASDSPHVTVETVQAAFDRLERCDVVLGPVLDGGYYLIGMRGWHDVLRGVAMSTSTVSEQIVARCRRDGLAIELIETTFDVDEASDLVHLRELLRDRRDLPATRAALESIPRPAYPDLTLQPLPLQP